MTFPSKVVYSTTRLTLTVSRSCPHSDCSVMCSLSPLWLSYY